MFNYAELNEQNVCIGVKSVHGEIDLPNHILIQEYDPSYLLKKYENEQWSEEQYLPDAGEIQRTRMEQLEKSQTDQDELLTQLMLSLGCN